MCACLIRAKSYILINSDKAQLSDVLCRHQTESRFCHDFQTPLEGRNCAHRQQSGPFLVAMARQSTSQICAGRRDLICKQEVSMGIFAALTAILNETGWGWLAVLIVAVMIIFGLYVGFR
jgi:hypothetical protein